MLCVPFDTTVSGEGAFNSMDQSFMSPLACGFLLGTWAFIKELHTCVIFAPLRLLLLLSNILLFSHGNSRKVCFSWISFRKLIKYFCSGLLVKLFTPILDDTLSRKEEVVLQWKTSSNRPHIPTFSRAPTALVFTSPEETHLAGLHHSTPQINFHIQVRISVYI